MLEAVQVVSSKRIAASSRLRCAKSLMYASVSGGEVGSLVGVMASCPSTFSDGFHTVLMGSGPYIAKFDPTASIATVRFPALPKKSVGERFHCRFVRKRSTDCGTRRIRRAKF